jgi:AsmA family/AsmA-like C-terminal region
VQATLLSVSIAIILALVAALVGPHFVDWSQYRSTFEAEASRLVGMPVRVAGAIDARLLPTPSLVLKDVEAGSGAESPQLRARELSIEFGLGPLLRGRWRASELRLVGPEIRVGLNQVGQIDWPKSSAELDPDQLSIDRLMIESGRLVTSDAGSGGRLVLDRLGFAGEFRSLLGPAKGEGSFAVDGESYRYSLAVGRVEDEAVKLRVEVTAGDRPWTTEADGVLRLADAKPEFEGVLKLARPAGAVDGAGRGAASVPWRANGHVKASAANALFDKAEFQYGPDERAIRLSGAANLKFGKDPRYDAVLSARQLDLDALLALPESTRRLPLAAVQELAELFTGPLKLPIPGRVGIGIDSVTLAGSPLRDVRGDLTSDAKGWDLEHFEFRAPGYTSARVSGRFGFADLGVSFHGPAAIEATDPKALLSWLEGRPVASHGPIGLLRASGELTLGSERIAIDRLKAEIDRKEFGGRVVYVYPLYRRPARLELELKAAELDLDALAVLAPAILAGSKPDFPGELLLSTDVDRAIFAGVAAKNASLKLSYDAGGLALDRLSVGDLGGASVKLSGRLRSLLSAPSGSMTLELKAGGLEGLATVAAKLVPAAGEAVRTGIARLSPLDLRADLTMDTAAQNWGRGIVSKLVMDGKAGQARLHLATEAIGNPFDREALELKLDGNLAADDGAQLLAVIGLSRFVNLEKGPGSARVTLRGRPAGDLEVDAQLAASGLSAHAIGKVRLNGQAGSSAGLDLSVAATDAAPLWGHGAWGQKLPVSLKTRLALSPEKLDFDDIAGSIQGSPVRGRIGIERTAIPRVEGQIETEEIIVPALLASTIGLPAQAMAREGLVSTEPFEAGWFGKLAGRIEFGAARAIFVPGFRSRSLHGVLRLDPGAVAFENVEGSLGGGRMIGELALRRDAAGVSTHVRVALTNVDTSAIVPGPGLPAVNGRLTLQLEADGAGYSPATLIGSLKGGGTISIETARLAALDPRAFEAAIRAADGGIAINAAKIGEVVEPALAAGELFVERADGALAIAAGQVRVSNVIAHGKRADLTLSGAVDLAGRTIDARLILSGPAEGGAPGTARPELFMALQGPAASPQRSVDVSALVSWLMLRSLDRETRRMEAVEAGRHDPAAPAPPEGPPNAGRVEPEPMRATPAPQGESPSGSLEKPEPATGSLEEAPTLPPPVEIRPAPGTGSRRAARPKEGSPAPARPLGRERAVSPQPQTRSIIDRLFGTHN